VRVFNYREAMKGNTTTLASDLFQFNIRCYGLLAMGVLYVDVSSLEEFVAKVVGLGGIWPGHGLCEVPTRPYEERCVRRGKPPTPVAIY